MPARLSHLALPTEPLPLSARRAAALNGTIRPHGDRSVSHCALILGLLSVGETQVDGLLESADIFATADACSKLGAVVERRGEGAWRIHGVGVGGLLSPDGSLEFGNAGTGVGLMLGVVAGHSVTATFDGDATLRRLPMTQVLAPLLGMGAEIVACGEGNRLPLILRGTTDPVPLRYEMPVASAQVKSAVLLAGLNAPGETTVIETVATRDHTERLLSRFGAEIAVTSYGEEGRRIVLRGRPELRPRLVAVPGDPATAAFALVAALIVPGSDVVIENVAMPPLRNGLIATLKEMGADITELDPRREGGEDVADLRVRHSALSGVEVPAARAPSVFDDYPTLAVAAAFATGETRMNGLGGLQAEEGDRLAAIAAGLAANGVMHHREGDDLVVSGSGEVAGGGMIAADMDHRTAMAFLMMGLASRTSVRVDDTTFIANHFPGFIPAMRQLGADFA